MEILIKLFGTTIRFVYHCFDRIVINGYLSMLSRPEQVVFFFHNVVGEPCITKEVLSKRTNDYNKWVASFANKRRIPLEWAEKGVRKEDYVRPWLRKMYRNNRFGVYFIVKSMEQGSTFRSVEPKYPTDDPNYRILKRKKSRFTHYYFYIRDEVLGPMSIRVASYLPFTATCWLNGHNFIDQVLINEKIDFKKDDNAFVSISDPEKIQAAAERFTPELIRERLDYWTFVVSPKFSRSERNLMNLRRFYAISQVEYCMNFIFRNNFPIRRLFQRSCELGLFTFTSSHVLNIFGYQKNRRFKGKLQTALDRLHHAHHTFRAYFKNSYVKQYEKLRTFLRMEVVSNHLPDIRVKKSLENLPVVKNTSRNILDRFARIQSQALNAHFDFPLFQRLALPIKKGKSRIPGIKIHDTRMIRLMETLIHANTSIDGLTSAFIHKTIRETYELSDYTINQLRYDLRKLMGHGLVERNGRHYSYWLTEKGVKVATMFILFHKRLCGPIANSLFNRKPDESKILNFKLEKAYQRADASIEKIIELLAA